MDFDELIQKLKAESKKYKALTKEEKELKWKEFSENLKNLGKRE